jgi:thiol-disulfide isomerase/thioredoxin
MERESERLRAQTFCRPTARNNAWRLVGLGGILAVCLLAWVLRKPITARVMQRSTLENDAPPASVIEEMIANDPSPVSAMVAAWTTDKIVHREVAIQQIGRSIPKGKPLPDELEAMLLAGALDPDQNVCEASFSGLTAWSHPHLSILATLQLGNADPEIRRLGLDSLRRNETSSAVEAIARLLDDPQPDIAALAVHALGRLTRQDFGIKLSDAIAVDNEKSGLKEFTSESFDKVRARAAVAKAWLRENPQQPSGQPAAVPDRARTARRRIPAPDFGLKALDGTDWRLSDQRGKVVLINFWTTWCTACVGELPALVELRRRNDSELVIVGVSLDNLADSHGHVGGHGSVGQDDTDGHHDGDGHDPHEGGEGDIPSIAEIRRKVEATVQRRGINYPVLIDARNEVGSRYNGGELPTTVIVDKEGFVRRRFVGPRSVEVFGAMVREAAQRDALLGPTQNQ